MTAGKIYALLDGRFNVSIEDIRSVALPALRHRLRPAGGKKGPRAERSGGGEAKGTQ